MVMVQNAFGKTALITDLDDTLYNWTDSSIPAFRAVVHALVRETGLDENSIVESFRTVFVKYRSVEYPFDLKELDIFADLTSEKLKRLMSVAWGAYNRVYTKRLTLYPGVRETLEWMRNVDIVVVALTDGERLRAIKRLKRLGILHYFHDVIARQNFTKPREQRASEVQKPLFTLPKNGLDLYELKPSLAGLLLILDGFQLNPKRTYLVGDNLWKDINVAQKANLVDIWACYGQRREEKNLRTLKEITDWSPEEQALYKRAKQEIIPTYTINSFSEVKAIILSRDSVQYS